MRDRLIELIYEAKFGANGIIPTDRLKKGTIEIIAEYLLANGVIVPPCEVGDTVFSFDEFYKRITEFQVTGIEIVVSCKSLRGGLHAFSISSFGKTLFHTRESAEQALRERASDEKS